VNTLSNRLTINMSEYFPHPPDVMPIPTNPTRIPNLSHVSGYATVLTIYDLLEDVRFYRYKCEIQLVGKLKVDGTSRSARILDARANRLMDELLDDEVHVAYTRRKLELFAHPHCTNKSESPAVAYDLVRTIEHKRVVTHILTIITGVEYDVAP
jgi:hypothetical protein